MNIQEQAIDFAGETLMLTNQRVVYWPVENTLILSDLHVGKAAHFRKSGIALPQQVASRDMDRLRLLLEHYQPQKVLITGDLLHAGLNSEVAFLKDIIEETTSEFLLVKGNHDRLSDRGFADLGIRLLADGFSIRNIHFTHGDQRSSSTAHTISGHLHPGVHVQVGRKSTMRFPCFVLSDSQLILPAFSLFSGLDTKSVPEGAACYAIYEDGLFHVSC
ncbi:ligase-associated DNA damage response endonuclease PdeM [Sphingobacterium sp. lm-10]|uniref:ligase-associated DNA damage response endonuclease PdeM n=1 Tax=Sphingobacterium sp. lm-10 TaxID=2944904 RepID=UPI002020BA08|nr:ligase-associated DNA damage response endonuclease PdeM [Sphingobacterium sp. lm-10]MCL7986933.1 ligase-associated DNA damage response endonuclease PdeM [Sphingobacterium sp. lm-10]